MTVKVCVSEDRSWAACLGRFDPYRQKFLNTLESLYEANPPTPDSVAASIDGF